MHEPWVLVFANKPNASVMFQVLQPLSTRPRGNRAHKFGKVALKILKYLYGFL